MRSLEAAVAAGRHRLAGKRELRKERQNVANHEPRNVALRVDPNFETLHNEPSFRKLMAQVGLPPLS